MAWITHRVSRGRRVAVVHWRVSGRHHGRTLGTDDEKAVAAALSWAVLKERGRHAPRSLTGSWQALTRFLRYLGTVRALGTVDCYRSKLDGFWKHQARKPMPSWDRSDFEGYVAMKKDAGWAPGSVQKLIASCRSFLKWAREHEIVVPDFVAGYRSPRIHRKAPKILPLEEVRALLAHVRGEAIEVAIALAVLGGLRIGEIYNARAADVDYGKNTLLVHGTKTGADRLIALPPALRDTLLRHQRTGGPLAQMPSTKSTAIRQLRRACRNAGVTETSFHPLRHTMATNMANTAPIHVIQKWLGHQNLKTTSIYLHAQPEDLQRAADGFELGM